MAGNGGAVNVLALTRYEALGSTSRVRFFQFLPALEAAEIHVTVAPLLDDAYIRALYNGERRGAEPIFAAYRRRFAQLSHLRNYDLLWIEKELLPWLPATVETFLARRGTRFVVDYDDATFHNYDANRYAPIRRLLGKKIDRVMQAATVVIAGNDYLGARAEAAGAKRIEYLPSIVDSARYAAEPKPPGSPFTIGWMGTPVTARYLGAIQSSLQAVCANGKGQILLVGPKDNPLPELAKDAGIEIELRKWSEATEARDVQEFDVGIMPLPDEPFERGKCGYKLIQYMASGRPVVATPLGVNRKIVNPGVTGFLAQTPEQWISALTGLRDDPESRQRMGQAGREKQEQEYSLEFAAPRLVEILRSAGD